MVTTPHAIAVAGSGPIAEALASHYRQAGPAVEELPLDPDAAGAIREPIALLLIADFTEPPAELTRHTLAQAMQRRTFLPFRIATVLKPRLAEAGGRAVLLSDIAARMTATGGDGPLLDRPFRAAAHALWRCLSVEWQADGITCGIVGIAPGEPLDLPALAETIGAGVPGQPCELIDAHGQIIGW